MKINSWNQVKKFSRVDSIAVIGNAPSALDYRIGHLINSCDYVIRINNYHVTPEYQEFVGKKTDVYMSHFYKKEKVKTLPELKEDDVKMIWATKPYSNYVSRWKKDIEAAIEEFQPYSIYVPGLSDFFSVSSKSDAKNLMRYILFLLLGPNIFKILGYKWPVPSGGLMAILLATRLRPQKIYITGFNFFTSAQAHYFSKELPQDKNHHQYDREPAIICKLIKQNLRIHYYLAVDPNLEGLRELWNCTNVEFITPMKSQASTA